MSLAHRRAALQQLPQLRLQPQIPDLLQPPAASCASVFPRSRPAAIRKSSACQPASCIAPRSRGYAPSVDKENAPSKSNPPPTPASLLSLDQISLHSGSRGTRESSPGQDVLRRTASLPAGIDEETALGCPKKRLSLELDDDEEADRLREHFAATRKKLSVELKSTAQGGQIATISPCAVSAMLSDKEIDPFVIIDCRYPYEWAGGAISGAVNLWAACDVKSHLFDSESGEPRYSRSTVVVLHCEYSIMRAPDLWVFLREVMRVHFLTKQTERYGPTSPCTPDLDSLTYPLCFVMEGGYSEFYKLYGGNPKLLRPGPTGVPGYVRQQDKQHVRHFLECEARRKADFCDGSSSLRRTSSAPTHTPVRMSTKRLRFGDEPI